MIRKYMMQGRVVATNLDLYLEHLLPPDNATVMTVMTPIRDSVMASKQCATHLLTCELHIAIYLAVMLLAP